MPAKESKLIDVVVLGGINTDFTVRGKCLPRPGQSVQGDAFLISPGGKGANQAVAAARLGATVALIGRVGEDDRGHALRRVLKREKIDLSHVLSDPKAPTGAAIIGVDEAGEKQINAALGANLATTIQQVREAEQLIANARVLLMQFEAPVACILAAAKIARNHGVKVVLDPAPPTEIPRELFPLLFAIRPNADEAEKITGQKVKNRRTARKAGNLLLQRGVQVAALEAGDEGDLILTLSEEIFLPRMKVKSIDATGAGDAFAGAFARGIAEGLSLKHAARLANATAALSTTKLGAQAALPSRREVENLLRKIK